MVKSRTFVFLFYLLLNLELKMITYFTGSNCTCSPGNAREIAHNGKSLIFFSRSFVQVLTKL